MTLSMIPAHFFSVSQPPPLPFSVLINRKFSAFNTDSPQKALPLLILNKVDFTSHPKR